MLFTIRNRDHALGIAARTSVAGLQTGQIVAFIAGDASGDQPKVRLATEAEIEDATIQKGLVWYRPKEDDADIDFEWNPATNSMTPKTAQTIPAGAQVTVYTGKLVVAYHKSLLPVGLQPGTVREPAAVAFSPTTGFPAVHAGASTDGTQIKFGNVYRVDGPEVTLIVVL